MLCNKRLLICLCGPLGDASDRHSPAKVQGLDGLNVVLVAAGDEHSIAVTGESFFNRHVYSWGLGQNGCVRVYIQVDGVFKSERAHLTRESSRLQSIRSDVSDTMT